MESSPLQRDEIVEMDQEDFVLVYDKIKIWKIAPWIIRGALILMAAVALVVVLTMGPDLVGLLFMGGFFVLAFAGTEWALRTFMRRLQNDLLDRKKRVVEGRLTKCYRSDSGSKNSSSNYVWEIGPEKFRVESAQYRLAGKGQWVHIELLPTAKIIIRLYVIPQPESA